MVALVSSSKLALSFIPNVEIITSLFIIFTLVFGWRDSFIASLLFVIIEIFIFGFMISWVLLYLIYWPLLVTVTHLIAWLFKRRRIKNGLKEKQKKITTATFVAVIIVGIFMTFLFGVLSAFLDMVFMGAIGTGRFLEFVFWRYVSGTWFFVAHIVGNAVALPLLVPKLVTTLNRVGVK